MKTAAIKPMNPRSPDTKHVGDEPVWRSQPTDNRITALSRAFNWYNYFYGKKEAKDMLVMYLDHHERSSDAKSMRSLPDSQIRLTPAWLARMSLMGLQLDEHEQIKLDNMIADMLQQQQKFATVDVIETEPVKSSRPSIQDHLREKVSDCAGELEGMFDEFVMAGARMSADYKPVAVMRSMNIAPQMVSMLKEIWQRRQQEFETVQEGRDSQLIEGYSFSKIQLRNIIKFCETVIDDCGAYVQIKKVERKPRKVKPVAPEKRAAKFKTLTEFAELKLKSLPASQLVDKSEAWLFDTKKRKLIHLVADEYAKAFTVKNNSVIGFSTAETQQKTLRKPADTLKALMAAGKPAARKLFKDLRATETAWNARGTENLLILRVW